MKIWAPRASPQQGEGWYPEATPTGPHGIGHTQAFPPSLRKEYKSRVHWYWGGLRLGSG